jgi:hypothetical protein
MLRIAHQPTIELPWTTMQPLRLGRVPSGVGTADLFVTISADDFPVLRVDLYGNAFASANDAIVWREHVFVGFGDAVYVIDTEARSGVAVRLPSYFAAFYPGTDYLLIASGAELLRLAPSGEVLWRAHDLALDGVVVERVENGLISGEGEWDPPGGWRPFTLRLETGQLVS